MAEQEYAFLKLTPALKGNARSKGHEDEIVVESLSFGHSQSGTWAEKDEASARVTTFSDLTFSKDFDTSSPALYQACAMKKKFDEAVVTLTSGDVVTLKMTLKKVLITNVGVNYGAGQDNPSENLSISFRWVQWEKGSEKTGFDLDTNQKV